MSETKVNAALGISGVALASVAISHYKLNSKINDVDESVDCLRQDLVDLAQVVKTMRKIHEEQIHQTSVGLRTLSSKVRKLEKTSGGKDLEKELTSIRSDLDSIIKSMTEGEPPSVSKSVTAPHPKKKKKKATADDDFDSYLDSLA